MKQEYTHTLSMLQEFGIEHADAFVEEMNLQGLGAAALAASLGKYKPAGIKKLVEIADKLSPGTPKTADVLDNIINALADPDASEVLMRYLNVFDETAQRYGHLTKEQIAYAARTFGSQTLSSGFDIDTALKGASAQVLDQYAGFHETDSSRVCVPLTCLSTEKPYEKRTSIEIPVSQLGERERRILNALTGNVACYHEYGRPTGEHIERS